MIWGALEGWGYDLGAIKYKTLLFRNNHEQFRNSNI